MPQTSLFDNLLSKLPSDAKVSQDSQGRRQVALCCPIHDDKNASLYFTEDASKILFCCHNPACTDKSAREEILKRLGVTWEDITGGSGQCCRSDGPWHGPLRGGGRTTATAATLPTTLCVCVSLMARRPIV